MLYSFIDYNDIENPVKTIPGKLIELALAPAEAKKLQVTLQSHEFTDHKSLLQMISSEDVTEFLNQESYFYDVSEHTRNYVRV